MEKRFDVRVPLVNTTLLHYLAKESATTGIVESRLLVQYATKFVEMMTSGAAVVIGGAGAASPGGVNGHTPAHAQQEQPALPGEAIDALYGEPDE
jgi:hypothetical protein